MKIKPLVFAFLAAGLVIFDELVKKFALANFPNENLISGSNFVRLAVHKNFGIAFDLPFGTSLTIVLTSLIICGLIVFIFKNKKNPWFVTAALITIIGAFGNLFDRIVYGFVVDYLIFPISGSAINLSDIVIIFGIIIFLISKRKKVI